jgi:hypothetical protein
MRTRRRFALALTAAAVTYGAIELMAFGVGAALEGRLSFVRAADERIRGLIGDDAGGEPGRSNVTIHPYFGFGNPPGFNFLERDIPDQTDPEVALVGITGGSVSTHMYDHSRRRLERALAETGIFGDRTVHVIRIGETAWKQPQQLMSATYYYAMGGRLDLLINLDGHNEVVDPQQNFVRGVYFAYPWLWYPMTADLLGSGESLRTNGELTFLRRLRGDAAYTAAHLPFSILARTLWALTDRVIERRIAERYADLAALEANDKQRRPFYRAGPKDPARTHDELLTASVRVWRDSTIQLDRLVEGNHGRYFHFIQPNQYVPGSKVLTPEERRDAYKPPNEGIDKGYPLLLREVEGLNRAGVSVVSLTDVFRDVEETVYVDSCCHLNPRGSDILAEAIAKAVGRLWNDGVTQVH